MAKLIYKFWAYAGYYNFVADIEGDTVKYKTKGLNFGSTKEGKLEGVDVSNFKAALAKAEIENWEATYEPNANEEVVMDIGHFNVCYVDDDNNVYITIGTEGYEPVEYDSLISSLAVCDSEAKQLLPETVILDE